MDKIKKHKNKITILILAISVILLTIIILSNTVVALVRTRRDTKLDH